MKLHALVAALMLLMIGSTTAANRQPFDIPPHGKPEQLLGDIKMNAPTAMAFDSQNRPYLLNNRNPESFGLLATVRNGEWVTFSLRSVLGEKKLLEKRTMHAFGELVIDDDDALYATIAKTLIYSPDLGETLKAYPVDGTLELRVGPNSLNAPPAISLITNKQRVDRGPVRLPEMAWWAQRSTLSLLLPTKDEQGLILGEPILISDNCLVAGSGGHSGGTSFAVTTAGKTHVVYAELPEDPRTGGSPIHISTVDRKTRAVVAEEFLVTAMPIKANGHARPTITVDSKGYLHVISGAHQGHSFFYMRSLEPNDITGGWTLPVRMSGRQTYASIVCDEKDQLHSVYRDFRPRPTLGYATASAADGEWGSPTMLVDSNTDLKYGIFYHRLFIDRASTLYLSFTFWEHATGAEGDYPEALAVSTDYGRTWQIAESDTIRSNR